MLIESIMMTNRVMHDNHDDNVDNDEGDGICDGDNNGNDELASKRCDKVSIIL